MSESVLFIGGRAHGQRRQFDTLEPTYCTEHAEGFDADNNVIIGRDTYRLERWRDQDGNTFRVYLNGRWEREEALEELLLESLRCPVFMHNGPSADLPQRIRKVLGE